MATVAILKASHAVLGANPLLEAADTIEASTSAAFSGAVKRPMRFVLLRYRFMMKAAGPCGSS